ncbi:uncharacterized protein LOC144677740 isoform X2 [Cetorhinus maximus]
MKPLKLLPTLWILVQLTETVKQSENVATDEIGPPGIDVLEPLKASGATGNPWGNLTLEKGGPRNFSAGTGRTNAIVAVLFVGLVISLMSISLYLTLTRKGCGRYNWKKQVDEESLN